MYRHLGFLALLMLAIASWPCLAAQSVTLVWNANQEPDIAGYRVYYRTASGDSSGVFDAGNATTFTVPNLVSGVTYFFAVTAYNSASLESRPSNRVSYPPSAAIATRSLTVHHGTGGGNYAVGTLVVVSANPPPEGSRFAAWTGDTPILADPTAPTTTAAIPSLDVTITATYFTGN